MTTFLVQSKDREVETLFSQVESDKVPYMPNVGDKIECYTDRIGNVLGRVIAFDTSGNLTVTFQVALVKTKDELIENWSALSK